MCKLSQNAIESRRKVRVFEAFAGVGITRLALEDLAKKLGIEFEYEGYSEIEQCH